MFAISDIQDLFQARRQFLEIIAVKRSLTIDMFTLSQKIPLSTAIPFGLSGSTAKARRLDHLAAPVQLLRRCA